MNEKRYAEILTSMVSERNQERIDRYNRAKLDRNRSIEVVKELRRPLEIAENNCNKAVVEYNRALKEVICIVYGFPEERFAEEPIPYNIKQSVAGGFCYTQEPLKKI